MFRQLIFYYEITHNSSEEAASLILDFKCHRLRSDQVRFCIQSTHWTTPNQTSIILVDQSKTL